jgi:spore coat polysaccharide biosynthesis protein SpsF (cytidylyltransferase family)
VITRLMDKKIGIVVAARYASQRLCGKALFPLLGTPMILFLMERLSLTGKYDPVLATTTLSTDDILAEKVQSAGFRVFRGDPENLVSRYFALSEIFGFDYLIRVTGDCPLVSHEIVDVVANRVNELEEFDLITTKPNFPVGLDAEMFSVKSLEALANDRTLTQEEQEHLTLRLYNKNYDVLRLQFPARWRHQRGGYTVDDELDYKKISRIVKKLGKIGFTISDLMEI